MRCCKVWMAMVGLLLLLVDQLLQVMKAAPCYPALFVFGDSLSDTGNGNLTGNSFFRRTTQRPYGETVPGTPFARFSDGLLLVDFLAIRIGLPLSKPYLDKATNFSEGVNYAVSGATAEDASYLRSKLISPLTDLSLDVQIGWHIALKASQSSLQNPSVDAYNNGLYMLEIGGNDYIAALNSLIYSSSYIATNIVPLVIAKIKNATEVLYTNGARNFLYMSITPLGCAPILLSMYPTSSKDSNGCVEGLNFLSYNHSASLSSLVNGFRSNYINATFTFVDYYGAYTEVINNSSSYGISNTLGACCGGGPTIPYRFSLPLFCNSLSSRTFSSTLCSNPNVFLNWDGIHFTHKFNSLVSNLTFELGSYLDPSNAFSTCNPNTT